MDKVTKLILLAILLVAANFLLYGLNSPAPTGKTLVNSQVVVLGECYFHLTPGWNLVSLCGNETDYSIGTLLRQIEGDYRYVMKWNNTQQNFDIYSPRAAVPAFENMAWNESIFILYQNHGFSTSYVGSDVEFEDSSIQLKRGWNSPAYPYLFNTTIEKALFYIEGKYRYVMKWDLVEQRFMIYSPRAAVPEFDHLKKGDGFIILMNPNQVPEEGTTLFYNKTLLES